MDAWRLRSGSRVGQDYGFTGVVGRVELGYDGASGSPPGSLIAKLPLAQDDAMSGFRAVQERDPARAARYYERCEREARFYREIETGFTPAHYYSAADDERRRIVVLLEDVGDGRQGDVLKGCSVEDAALVIDQLAPFHARWWGEPAPAAGFRRWGADPDPAVRQTRYAAQVDPFLDAYGGRLPGGICRLVERLRSQLGAVAAALDERHATLIHADLHLDNLTASTRSRCCFSSPVRFSGWRCSIPMR